MDKLKNKCVKKINYGIIFRILATLLILILIYLHNSKNKSKIYLILPILLIILDSFDNIYLIKQKKCTKTFHYQLNDKINDLLTYFLVFLIFKVDNTYLIFLIWRTIGVILFGLYKNSIYLIIMFDFMKEYLLYLYLFNNNKSYIGFFILGKIIFESYYHTRVNKKLY